MTRGWHGDKSMHEQNSDTRALMKTTPKNPRARDTTRLTRLLPELKQGYRCLIGGPSEPTQPLPRGPERPFFEFCILRCRTHISLDNPNILEVELSCLHLYSYLCLTLKSSRSPTRSARPPLFFREADARSSRGLSDALTSLQSVYFWWARRFCRTLE